MSNSEGVREQAAIDARAADDYGGAWVSCSGCVETHDGHTDHYPRHPTHGCAVGGGCDECNWRGVTLMSLPPHPDESEPADDKPINGPGGTTWVILPDTGLEVMFGPEGLPYLLRSMGSENDGAALLELEARHGWRVQTRTLTNHDSPRGWIRAVEWAGTLATSMTYDEIKSAPVADYTRMPDNAEVCKLTGMDGVSITNQLREEWRGHPAGTYIAWASHPGKMGTVRMVGMTKLILALVTP